MLLHIKYNLSMHEPHRHSYCLFPPSFCTIIIVVCCLNGVLAVDDYFATDYFTFGDSSGTPTGTPYNFTNGMIKAYPLATHKRYSVFTSFIWDIESHVNLAFTYNGGTDSTMQFWIQNDAVASIFLLTGSLLLIADNPDILWVYAYSILEYHIASTTTSINTYSTGINYHTHIQPLNNQTFNDTSAITVVTFLRDFHADCMSAGSPMATQIYAKDDGLINSTAFAVKIYRSNTNQRIWWVGLLTILFKQAQITATNTQFYTALLVSHSNNLLSSSTFSSIHPKYIHPVYGGHRGYCLFGLRRLLTGQAGAGIQRRSYYFDPSTAPPIGIQNFIYSADNFIAQMRVFCLIPPPSCISYCHTCLNGTHCSLCDVSYGLNASSTGCQPCSTLISQCVNCTSYNHCTSCVNSSYGISGNYSCQPCSSLITGCLTCVNSTHCTACIDNTTYLTVNNALCLPCPFSLPYCLTCSNQTTCLTCDSSAYLTAAQQCSPCYSLTSNCLTCNSTQCLTCTAPLLLTSNFSCLLCNEIFSLCLVCTNSSYCQQCQTGYFFDPNTSLCQLCSQRFPDCTLCAATACSACIQDRLLSQDGQHCPCALGHSVNSLCTQVQGCTNAIRDSQGLVVCLKCDDQYFQSVPVDDKCVCLKGTWQGAACTDTVGCLQAIYVTDDLSSCLTCNVSAGFLSQPQSGSCQCPSYLYASEGACFDRCGDGRLFSGSSNSCDDGNLQDGDGCSSSCTIQTFYRCQNGSQLSPSVCYYLNTLNVSLLSVRRSSGLNQGIFQFEFTPALLSLNKLDVGRQISFVCASTYELTQIVVSGGVLTITADYTEDMEGRDCTITITFDSNMTRSAPASLSFKAISENSELVVSHHLDKYATINSIFYGLSLAVVGVFVLSLGHKMMGAQLIMSCQLVYFSVVVYKRLPYMFTSVSQFRLVTWQLSSDTTDTNNAGSLLLDRLAWTPSFIQNTFLVILSLAFLSVCWLATKVVVYCLQLQVKPKRLPVNDTLNVVQKLCRWIYRVGLVPIAAAFLMMALLANQIHASFEDNTTNEYQSSFSSSCILFLQIVLASVVAQETITAIWCRGRSKSQSNEKKLYIPVFLFRSIVLALLLSIYGYTSQRLVVFSVLFGSSLAYSAWLLIYGPYKAILDTVGILLDQLTVIYAFSLVLLARYIVFQEMTWVLLIFALQGLISVNIAMTLLRLALHYIKCIRQLSKDTPALQSCKELQSIEKQALKTSNQHKQPLRSYQQQLHPFKRAIKYMQKSQTPPKPIDAVADQMLIETKRRLKESFQESRKKAVW